MLKSPINKVAGLKEYYENFKNTYFEGQLQTTASGASKVFEKVFTPRPRNRRMKYLSPILCDTSYLTTIFS